ncbi:hypothetical protein FOBRF1_009107 [Fusarium oxysporum]
MNKRKHSHPPPPPPEPQLRRSRLRNKLCETVYVENTDSYDDSAHGPVSTARDASRARQSRNRPEDSEDSYLDDSEDDYDSDDNSEHLENTAEPDEAHTDELCNNPDEDVSPSVTIIPLEKMRDDGGIAYVDYKLHPNSLFFLEDLKSNNNRAWLKGTHEVDCIEKG